MMMNGSWPKSLRERNFRAAKKLAVQQKAIINRSRGRPDQLVPTSVIFGGYSAPPPVSFVEGN